MDFYSSCEPLVVLCLFLVCESEIIKGTEYAHLLIGKMGPWSVLHSWLECCLIQQEIVGSISSQDTYPNCGFDPWLVHMQEAIDQYLSLFLSPPPPLPFPSPSLLLLLLLFFLLLSHSLSLYEIKKEKHGGGKTAPLCY